MESWDPIRKSSKFPTKTCLTRIKKDLQNFKDNPLEGIFIVPDENDIALIHALIIGPNDTPYAGGFFYFLLRVPPNYPMEPPKVKLMTTGGNKIRFNPNLYNEGKVCLSILGTWNGPPWSPAQTISSVLLSIQSLMNENPYFNEPGLVRENKKGDSKNYNQYVQHETLRVAVCDMVEGKSKDIRDCPQALKDVIRNIFLKIYDFYAATAQQNINLTNRTVASTFNRPVCFNYVDIQRRLERLKNELVNGATP